jgi:hypothetical protein
MADLKPVSPGQPIVLSAGDHNAMLDAARAHRARQQLTADEPAAKLQSGIILVKNASGSDRSFLDVLAIDVPLILPTDSLNEWRSRVALSCISPGSTHAGRYVVLQEPIPAGKMGRAMVIGVTPVNLDVTADTDRFAEVVTGVSASLKTGTTGSARILWKESGTGAKRGIVMLTGEGGAGGGAAPTDDGQVWCSKTGALAGEWTVNVDVGKGQRTATATPGSVDVAISADGDAVRISDADDGIAIYDRSVSDTVPLIKIALGHASLNATGRQIAVNEASVCDAGTGTVKTILLLRSSVY